MSSEAEALAAGRPLPQDFKVGRGYFAGVEGSGFGCVEIETYVLPDAEPHKLRVRRPDTPPRGVPLDVNLAPLQSRILTDEQYAPELKRFFHDTIMPSKLVYRGSRDGFKGPDWASKCLMQGPTMMIVKCSGTGYIFGSYIATSWPNPPKGLPDDAEQWVCVADHTRTSFMFSLKNGFGRALRFKLAHPANAGGVRDGWGPIFGQ
jgi:hypothetical protein